MQSSANADRDRVYVEEESADGEYGEKQLTDTGSIVSRATISQATSGHQSAHIICAHLPSSVGLNAPGACTGQSAHLGGPSIA